MSLALVLLASTLAGNVDTTNLWTGIPKELSAVSITALDGKASPYGAIAKKVTVISFYSSVIGDPRDAQALDAVARELAGNTELAIVFVSIDMPHTAEERATLGQLVQEMKVKLPVWSDDQLGLFKWVNGRLRESSGRAMPSNEMRAPTFVVLRGSELLAAESAPRDLAPDALRVKRRAAILEALGKK